MSCYWLEKGFEITCIDQAQEASDSLKSKIDEIRKRKVKMNF